MVHVWLFRISFNFRINCSLFLNNYFTPYALPPPPNNPLPPELIPQWGEDQLESLGQLHPSKPSPSLIS